MSEQLDLLTVKMYKREGTSKDAAKSAAKSATETRAKVLEAIKSSLSGLSASQVESKTGIDLSTVRPRISELANRFNLIEDSTRRLKTRFGKSEIVWITKRS